ncbi:MAG: hypothetical protein ABI120_18260, partial [Gemmatimonadaceae bacterium]
MASPTLSPDGRLIAFTVTTVREAENKRHTEVWLQPVAGGASKRMTSTAFESTAPRWSDDGKTLFFTSTRPYTTGTQWAVRLDEGGEAFQPEGAAAGGGRGGRADGGGRGGFGAAGGEPMQPTDKRFTITSATTSGAPAGGAASGRGGSPGGRGGDNPQTETVPVNPADPYVKMQPMARPPAASITKPVNPERFDGRHIIDPTYRSNDGGFQPSTGRGGAGRGGFGAGTPSSEPTQLFIQHTGSARKALTATAY